MDLRIRTCVAGIQSAVALALLITSAGIEVIRADSQRQDFAAGAATIAPPEVVIDVTTSLGITPSCISIDSIHFSSPMLLVGTDTNVAGVSYVFLIDPTDLEIVDTGFSLHSKVNAVTAGHVDLDSSPDYLVGTSSAAILVNGESTVVPVTFPIEVKFPLFPWDSLSDTLTTIGTTRDLAIDDGTGAFWIAYSTDVSYSRYPLESTR